MMPKPIKTLVLFISKSINANYGRAFGRAAHIAREIRKPVFFIIIDMLWCVLRYGTAFTDYFMFRFYEKPASGRKSFLTMRGNNKLVAHLNSRKYRHYLDVKTDMVKRYAEFLHRDAVILGEASRDEAVSFIKRSPVFFAKKNYTFAAQGTELFRLSDYDNENELYNKLLGDGFDLIEEPIIQHKSLDALYPDSVNTVRVVTVYINGKCDIVFAALKTGKTSFVDNLNAGGIAAAVDIETGTVYTDAVSKTGERFESHPVTHVPFMGFKIPMWESVVELVDKVSGITPELRFVGWDIAIANDGPLMVEGNYLPGYDLLQIPDMTGRKWILDKYVR
jgi:hypothetical protein